MDSEEEQEHYEVEAFRDIKKVKKELTVLFKWKGYSEEDNSWEPLDHIYDLGDSAVHFIKDLRKDIQSRTVKKNEKYKYNRKLRLLDDLQTKVEARVGYNSSQMSSVAPSSKEVASPRKEGLAEAAENPFTSAQQHAGSPETHLSMDQGTREIQNQPQPPRRQEPFRQNRSLESKFNSRFEVLILIRE